MLTDWRFMTKIHTSLNNHIFTYIHPFLTSYKTSKTSGLKTIIHFLEQCSSTTNPFLLLVYLKHYSPLKPWISMPPFSIPDGLWPFPACHYISIILKSSSTLPLHLLHYLPHFLAPSTVTVAICFGIYWFCILSA